MAARGPRFLRLVPRPRHAPRATTGREAASRRGRLAGPGASALILSGLLATACLTLPAGQAVGDARTPGVHTASASTRLAVVHDLGLDQPAFCYRVRIANSDARWGLFTSNPRTLDNPRCQPGDGWSAVQKTTAGWVDARYGGSDYPPCARMPAPRSVRQDFAAADLCG